MSAALIEAGNNLAAAVRNGSAGIVSAALAAWFEAAESAEDITSGTEQNPIGESGGVLAVGLPAEASEDVFAAAAAEDVDEGAPGAGARVFSDVEAASVVEAAQARAEAEGRAFERVPDTPGDADAS